METRRFSFLASIGLFVLVPCLAQEPAKAGDDPFGRSVPTAADPFGKADPSGAAASGTADPPARSPRSSRRNLFPADVQRENGGGIERPSESDRLKPEERIRNELKEWTSIHFVESPLSDAVRQLAEMHDIPILIDNRALEEIGLTALEPVNLSLKNVSLEKALRLLLSNLDMTYMIHNEVLVITTAEAAEQNLGLRVIPLPASLIGEQEDVITAIETTIVPDIWQSAGGPARIAFVKNTLVVAATDPVMEDVESFLQKLADAVESQPAPKVQPTTAR